MIHSILIGRGAFALASIASLALIGVIAFGIVSPGDRGSSRRPDLLSRGGAQPSNDAGAKSPIPVPGHEVYGFIPYWEMDGSIAAHLARTRLFTVGLFSVTHGRNGAMATRQRGYKQITGQVGQALIATARKHDIRAEIVYTSFGADKNRRFFDDPTAQARWIDELVAFVDEQGLDGVDVDVEVLPPDLVPAYGEFVGRLREALRAKRPAAQVSVATQANALGAAMAVVAAQAGADRIFLMGYDFHWAGSEPGASAPLERLDGEPEDLRAALELYRALGVPVERTLLGLPLFGMVWPVSGPGLGSSAAGRGDGWVPRRNLGVLTDPTFVSTYDPIESVEFYAARTRPDAAAATDEGPVEPGAAPDGGAASLPPAAPPDAAAWQAVYYDSPRSLTPKLALADDLGLAGAGFWAIGYERKLPGYTDLISDFRAGVLQSAP